MSLPTPAARLSLPWYRLLIADPARAARMGATLVLALAMAWSLGARDFGALQSALALAAILSAATSLGLDPLVRQQLRDKPYETASTLGTSMALRCGLGMIAYVAMLCFTSRNQETPQSIWLVAALMVLMQTPLLLGLRLEEAGHNERVRFARNFGFAISSLLVLAMVWRDADPVWFACAIVLEQPMVALLLLYSHGRIAPEEEAFTWETDTARRWLRRCKSTCTIPLIPLLLVPVSLLMLVARKGTGAAGSFSLAVVLFEVGAFCAAAVLAGHLASASGEPKDESTLTDKERDERFNRSSLVGWACAAGAALLSILVGFTLLRNRVSGLPLVGSLVALSLLPYALGLARDALAGSTTGTKSRTRTQLVTAGLNIVLAFVLDRGFGAVGAAASLFASVVVGELLLPLFVASERKLARSQGKALILWSRWHGVKTPAPIAPPVMPPETSAPTAAAASEPALTLRTRLAPSAETIDAVSPTGAVAKSS